MKNSKTSITLLVSILVVLIICCVLIIKLMIVIEGKNNKNNSDKSTVDNFENISVSLLSSPNESSIDNSKYETIDSIFIFIDARIANSDIPKEKKRYMSLR